MSKKSISDEVLEKANEMIYEFGIEPEKAIKFEKDILKIFCAGLELGKSIKMED